MDIVAAANRGVREALRAGAQEADAFVTIGDLLAAEVERASIKTVRRSREGGIGVRAYVGGSLGFAYGNQLKATAVARAARNAVAQARAGTPDPDFHSLPEPGPLPRVQGLYDRAVVEVHTEEVIAGLGEAAVEGAAPDPRIYSVGMTLHVGSTRSAIANSHGVEAEAKETAVQAVAEVVAKEGAASSSSASWAEGRSWASVDLVAMVASASSWALRGLRFAGVATEDLPVVLDPLAVVVLLGVGLGAAVNGEEVQRRHSYLADYLGERVASPVLRVTDDATLPSAAGSYPFDGEGAAGRRTPLVEGGILRSFLHDSYTAGKAGVETTGNALRNGGPGGLPSFRSIPAIGTSNLVLAPGRASMDDLVGPVRRGIYVRATGDRPNLATGEFSGLVSEGFLIRDGELAGALRETAFATPMLDLLRGVEEASRDQVSVGGVIAPGLRIRGARVTGSGA